MTDTDGKERGPKRDLGTTSGNQGGPSAATYAGLGLQLLVSILLFLYLGQWLDRRFGTNGILTVIGVLFGAGIAIFGVYRRLVADQRRDELRRE